jgi:hypothetical protein
MKGFKNFVMRGNLVELAVAFIMAAAFAAVVTTFTNRLLSLIPAGPPTSGTPSSGCSSQRWCPSSSSLRSSIFSSSPHTKKLRRVSESRRPRLRTPTTSCCLRRSATCSPPVQAAPYDPAAPFEPATQQCASPKGGPATRPVGGETHHRKIRPLRRPQFEKSWWLPDIRCARKATRIRHRPRRFGCPMNCAQGPSSENGCWLPREEQVSR